MARRKSGPGIDAQPDTGPDFDPEWCERIRGKLVEWYETAHRDLPWRASRDPYRILVSETMLVQTTVTAVVPFFERFITRFPTIRDLANADEADVLKAWEGLGYYRRARQLHAAGQAIVRDHGGVIPDDPDALRALPGVGRYIAGAILSFAFNIPAPILEANTQRVMARWLAWPDDIKSTRSQARLWEAATRVVPTRDPATFNQAFMELGALVCIPRNPMCLTCPVATECRARELGLQDRLPVATPKAAPLEMSEAAIVVVENGRVLMLRRKPGVLWEGFWEFPTVHRDGPDPARRLIDGCVSTEATLEATMGLSLQVGPVVSSLNYVVTKHKVRMDVHFAIKDSGDLKPGPGHVEARWVDRDEFEQLTRSSATRRAVAALLKAGVLTSEGEWGVLAPRKSR